MNFQQLSNLQYWSSLFSSPWSIVTNIIDIALVAWILFYFTKAIAGTKIMILVRGVLIFVLAQILANAIGLTTVSWLINQVITYGVIAAVVIFSPEIRTGLEQVWRGWGVLPICFRQHRLAQKKEWCRHLSKQWII